MKIAIIGAGNVGGTLAARWAELGHEVTLGVRSLPDAKADALARACEGSVEVATVQDAAAGSAVILLSVPWGAAQAAVESLGDLGSKVLIDCTNPWVWGEGLKLGFETSGAEQIASWAKGGRVTKALNQTGFENMADPVFAGRKAVMFVAGDDADARATTTALVSELGFEAIEVGELTSARLLEPHAVLWIELVTKHGQERGFAWGLLRR
ncbi:NADPH-dependent F420 reductase [Engelhardtia mirabilis]|uniref:2-dehydropantoate 2-reductase n=1 Tax=Engelhardtia mirabilis TaxID=2528011 RepID=A0A518BIH3_9BACT|nr:2-dehydropantoate 2-reductase [Planctomycetes bacterium Pla133]QDV01069.1 2-dehydropantoate 2-reductase [Planctomycetes bacterium Pla86]